MQSDNLKTFTPDRVYVDREVEDLAITRSILDRLGGVPCETIDDVQKLKRITDLCRAKREWILTSHRGRAFKPCQGMPLEASKAGKVEGQQGLTDCNDTPPHICCCYQVIDLVSGCPMDCSYCILQHYLENNPRTTIYVNADEILGEVDRFLKENKSKRFRIGTGELGDSLALDSITGHASKLIPFFAEQTNAVLELKTKTDFVDHLLDLNHNGNTVVSWSVNTERIVKEEERFAASLDKRFAAAKKCVDAGYRVGFHFDPIIMVAGSDKEIQEYLEVIDRILDAAEPNQIAWVSLGLLRLPYQMKSVVQRRFPDTRIFSGELVPAGGKMRYARFLREGYYRPLWDKLTKHLPQNKVYLCMETESVWNKLDGHIKCHEGLENRLN